MATNQTSMATTTPTTVLAWSKLIQHTWISLFFVAIAGCWAIFSWNTGVEHIKQSDTAIYYFKVAMQYKHEREEKNLNHIAEWQWSTLSKEILTDQRTVYKTTDIDSLYQNSFERYLGTVYRVTGDVTLGYKILVFPLNLLFLFGTYALFLHLTGKPIMAAFFAIMAAFPIAIPIAGEYFGMGPVTIYSRRNFFTAFAPFAIYLFYRCIQNPRQLIFTFTFLGLISNLHSSGILLAEILIFTYLVYNNNSIRSWVYSVIFGSVAAVFGFIAIGGLWGKVESFIYGFLQIIIPNAYADTSNFLQKEGMPEGVRFLFYPLRIYSHLPDMVFHGMTFFTVIISVMVLLFRNRMTPRSKSLVLFMAVFVVLAYLGFSEFEFFLLAGASAFALTWRQPIEPKLELTHYLILAIFFVSFIGMLLFQAGYYFIDGFPLVFDQLRGTRFLGLMVFVWLAVLIARIDWEGSVGWGKRLFVVCAALAVLMTLRQDFRSWIRYKEDPDSIALLDVARWSKMHTPEDASFLVVSTRFGIVAERNVLLHDREARTVYGRMLIDQMQRGYSGMDMLARDKRMDYIVVKKDQDKLPAGTIPVYDNQRYALVKVD